MALTASETKQITDTIREIERHDKAMTLCAKMYASPALYHRPFMHFFGNAVRTTEAEQSALIKVSAQAMYNTIKTSRTALMNSVSANVTSWPAPKLK